MADRVLVGVLLAWAIVGGPSSGEALARRMRCSDAVARSGPAPARRAPLVAVRRPEEIPELTIVAYNVLDMEDGSGRARAEQGAILREMGADLGILPEVMGMRALVEFNDRSLAGAFAPHLIHGNDQRGIEIGLLVKRDLPFEVEHRTYKDVTWNDPQHGRARLFSRDLPVLILRIPGEKRPALILVGTHFKSKRSRDGDPESRRMRRAQVDGAVAIMKDLQREFGESAPIVFGGDANGNVNHEAEFANLKKALALEDVFDVVSPPLTRDERVTHTFHPQGGGAKWEQVDVLMVAPSLRACVKRAWVYRYKDASGRPKPIPRTFRERERNPSDHFPIALTLDFACVLRLLKGPGA